MNKKKESKVVPNVRFKGFTDVWKQRKVRDVTDRYDNLRIPVAANLRVSGTTPYYGANGIQDYVDGYTHDGEFILVAEDGANDLKNYPVRCVQGRIWVNNHAHVLQGKYDSADNKFLACAISQADIESLLVGGGRAKLNAENLMDMNLLLPNKAEQMRIGKYLAQLDHLITLHQQKITLLTKLKKAMLEKMFPKKGTVIPEFRFNGFANAWEQRKFSQGVSEIGDGLHGTPTYCDNGNVFFINGNNLVDGKIVINSETKTVDETQQSLSDKDLDDNTILLSINGTIGNLAYYSGEKLMLGKSAAYIKVSAFDIKFVYTYLQTPSVHSYFMNSLTGTTIKNLGLKAIREMKLDIPQDIDEQKKIGDYFSTLDNLITLHQRKIDKIKNMKKVMLDQMFI